MGAVAPVVRDAEFLCLDELEAVPPSPAEIKASPKLIEDCLARAYRLARHYEDGCVAVAEPRVFEGRVPIRLCTFATREGTLLYALVDQHGDLHVGHVARLDQAPSVLRLGGFQRRSDEVLSLVAAGPQPGRVTCDVWVVVRHWPQPVESTAEYAARQQLALDAPWPAPELRLFHAVVSVGSDGDATPRAWPAQDDQPPLESAALHDETLTAAAGRRAEAPVWRPSPMADLPAVFERFNLSLAFGEVPFSPEVRQVPERLGAAHVSGFLAVAPGVLLWTDASHELHLSAQDLAAGHNRRGHKCLSQQVRAVAPIARAYTHEDQVRVAVCDDEHLIGLCFVPVDDLWNLHGQTAWAQRLRVPPRALASVGPAERERPWPDLLLGAHDGHLWLLRALAPDAAVTHAWARLWRSLEEALSLNSASAFVQWARVSLKPGGPTQAPGSRQAVLMRAAQHVLNTGCDARTREDYANLLRDEPLEPGLEQAMTHVLGALEHWARGGPKAEGAPTMDVAPALTFEVYDRYAPFTLQERIDLVVRRLLLAQPNLAQQSAFAELARHCRKRPDESVAEGAAQPRPPHQPGDPDVRRHALHLERWANCFVFRDASPVDALRATLRPVGVSQPPWLPHAVILRLGDARVLVLASANEVWGLRIDSTGRFDEPSLKAWPCSDGVAEFVALRDEHHGDSLLVASRDGACRRLTVQCREATLEFTEAEQALLPGGQNLSALTALPPRPSDPPGWWLAAASTRGRVARVFVARWRPGIALDRSRVSHWSEPGVVRCLNLAWSDAGLQLVIGKGADTVARVVEFAPNLLIIREIVQRVDGPFVGVRIDDPHAPHYVALAAGEGYVWSLDLRQVQRHLRVSWIYKLEQEITALGSLRYDGRLAFLAGADDGRLVLLDAATGQRLWKHTLPARVTAAALTCEPGSARTLLAALTSDGTLWLMREQPRAERQQAIESLRATLKSLPAPDPQPSVREDRQTVWAFQSLEHGTAAHQVLAALKTRVARARVLRGLLELPYEVAPRLVVGRLTRRELALCQYWLPRRGSASAEAAERRRQFAGWQQAIDDCIARPDTDHPTQVRGDDGVGAWASFWVAWLQWQAQQGVLTRERLQALVVPTPVLGHPWVRLEFARMLLQATVVPGLSGPQLAAHLLDTLAQAPRGITVAAATAVSNLFVAHRFVAALANVLRAVDSSGAVRRADALRIAAALEHVPKPSSLVRLTIALIAVGLRTAVPMPSAPGSAWSAQRGRVLSTWRRLQEVLQSEPAGGLCERLHTALRGLFPERLLPEDMAKLVERRDWMVDARTRTDIVDPLPARKEGLRSARDSGEWADLVGHLRPQVAAWLRNMARLELATLRETVRPRLRLDDRRPRQRQRDGRVTWPLVVEAEGFHDLDDVEVEVQAVGRDGLLPAPGCTLDWRGFYPRYPAQVPAAALELSGYVLPTQGTLRIRAQLRSARGSRSHDEEWCFELPDPQAPPTTFEMPFPEGLPRMFLAAQQRALAPASGLAVVVLDDDVGRQAFVEAARARWGAWVVDVDEQLHGWGPGRAHRWEVEHLRALASAGVQRLGATQRLVLTRLDTTLQRLLEGEGPQVAEEVLRIHVPHVALERRLVLVVSSSNAARVTRGLAADIVDVHSLLARSDAAPGWHDDALAWVARIATLEAPAAQSALATLGFDLRLLTSWLRSRPRPTPHDFAQSEPAQDVLRRTLAGLTPFELVCALAGAIFECELPLTELRAGHVPVRDWHTAEQHRTGRLLQAAGHPFTVRVVSALRSGSRPPASVRVEGLGLLSASQSPLGSQLALLLAARTAARTAVEDGLQAMGVAERLGAVLRTRPPYRDLMRAAYASVSGAGVGRDAQVCRMLRSGDLLLQAVTLDELAASDPRLLELLLPDATPTDRQAFVGLLRTWTGLSSETDSALVRIFARPELRSLPEHDTRSDSQLASLARGETDVRVLVPDPARGAYASDDYLVWLGKHCTVTYEGLRQALRDLEDRERARLQGQAGAANYEVREATPARLVALGPGVESWPPQEERRLAWLTDADLLSAAARANREQPLAEQLENIVRGKLRLTSLSPYRTAGALPARSPLFVGREREQDFVRANIGSYSILIVGARRIGKTSLFNQVCAWIHEQRPNLLVVRTECEGIDHRTAFERELRAWCATQTVNWASTCPSDESLARHIALRAREEQRTLVLAMNEIDRLLAKDESYFAHLRGLSDNNLLRLLCVGYVPTLDATRNVRSPFYHLFQSPDRDRSALVLGAIEEGAAQRLVDLLEQPPLRLRWQDAETRRQGYDLLMHHSYRIPWLLQALCHDVVSSVEQAQRTATIQLDNVRAALVLSQEALWTHIEKTDVAELLGRARQPRLPPTSGAGRTHEALNAVVRLILIALVRTRYLAPGEPDVLRDPALGSRPTMDFAFTVSEARDACQHTLDLLLMGAEPRRVATYLQRLDLGAVFESLALTIVLERDPERRGRYAFLRHIYPCELWRRWSTRSPTLDQPFVDTAREFWSAWSKEG